MFSDHQPRIAAFGRENPEQFAKVCEFALATIRVHLRDAAKAVAANERPSGVYFGSKLDGLAYLELHREELYIDAEESEDDGQLLGVFMRIPGIGPAKAGFLAQMLYGRVGCLDTHQLVRFGMAAFRSNKKGHQTIARYIDACKSLGTPQELWDGWCAYVAHREATTPEAISELHLAPIRSVR